MFAVCAVAYAAAVDVVDPISTQASRIAWKVAPGIGACLLPVGPGVLAA